MPPKRKKAPNSDAEYKPPKPPKQPRVDADADIDIFFHTSSAPASPRIHPAGASGHSPEVSDDEDEKQDDIAPLPDLLSRLVGSLPSLEPSTLSAACTPPRKGPSWRQAKGEETQYPLTAFARTKLATAENRKKKALQAAEEKLKQDAEAAASSSAMEFFQSLMSRGGDTDDAQASANLTRFLNTHAVEIIETIIDRVPAVGQEFLDKKFDEKLEKVLQAEGKAIQDLLTRRQNTSVMQLLEEFSMEQLGEQLEEVAPTLWQILERTARPNASTRREAQGETRREKRLQANNYQVVIGLFLLGSGASKREIEVLAHAGLSTSYNAIREHIHQLSAEAVAKFRRLVKEQMFFIVWDNLNIAFRVESQRLRSANHFDNGTTSTGIPVYNPLTGSTKTLHGTLPLSLKPPRTSTFPVVDHSVEDVLPSPLCISQLEKCLLWQIKRLAHENIKGLAHLSEEFEDCPEVDAIAVHKTEQYPLPAMHEDESSIDGTIRVYNQILQNLGLTDDDLEAHGLMFADGDLLTNSLVDKIESARRNSEEPIAGMKATIRRFGLFHAKMAGCRMVINEHWGKPNSLWPGSLWWEHTQLLKRKPISAGWKAKKATPWKPSHELLQISLAAHVKDGFRIHCGAGDLEAWALSASASDFNAVAEQVFRKLFTTEAVDNLRSHPERDITHENVVLLNRDALFYIEFVSAIKKGDIGRVINILQVWMVMMRAPKTMPKYADAIFETLRRIDRYDPVLKRFFLHNWLVNLTGRPFSFKEIDLLQEHQNFWAKIIYNAKGSNRSWHWLAMISVCIFILRDTMRTVQKAFNITNYGDRHTVPDMSNEIQTLADALEEEKLQQYISTRPGNDAADSTSVAPVRDLLEEGAKYADTRGAFKRFTEEKRRAENIGFVDGPITGRDPDGGEDDESGTQEDYEVTGEDLEMDSEEPYADADLLLAAASELFTG
ncbi:hypothetical protein R3P38DRAFT_3314713 [Favolaschia claudopus]|uniref:DUF6589 domain-containing protein n=1 Tax=Favolaschia claudopus TaxID=2862362 RepID=A0AAW0BR53_9AGAR